MVDTATKICAARVPKQERGTDVVRALGRAWIRPYGTPKLQIDEARGFCSPEVRVFLEHYGVELDVAPGEAHSRLGIVEPRHLTHTAVQTYFDDLQLEATLENVREAVMRLAAGMVLHRPKATELRSSRPIRSHV